MQLRVARYFFWRPAGLPHPDPIFLRAGCRRLACYTLSLLLCCGLLHQMRYWRRRRRRRRRTTHSLTRSLTRSLLQNIIQPAVLIPVAIATAVLVVTGMIMYQIFGNGNRCTRLRPKDDEEVTLPEPLEDHFAGYIAAPGDPLTKRATLAATLGQANGDYATLN